MAFRWSHLCTTLFLSAHFLFALQNTEATRTGGALAEYNFDQCECSDGGDFSDQTGSLDLSRSDFTVSCPTKDGFGNAARRGVKISPSNDGTVALTSGPTSLFDGTRTNGFSFEFWIRPTGFDINAGTVETTLVEIKSNEILNYKCGIRLVPISGSIGIQVSYASILGLSTDLTIPPLLTSLDPDAPMHVVCGWRITGQNTVANYACVNNNCVEENFFLFPLQAFEPNSNLVIGELTNGFSAALELEIISATYYDFALNNTQIGDNFAIDPESNDPFFKNLPVPSTEVSFITNEDDSTTGFIVSADDTFFDADDDANNEFFVNVLQNVGQLKLSGVDVVNGQILSKTDVQNLEFIPAENVYTTENVCNPANVNDYVGAFELGVKETSESCILNTSLVKVCIQQVNDIPVAAVSNVTVFDTPPILELEFSVGTDADDVTQNGQPTSTGLNGGAITLDLALFTGKLYPFVQGCNGVGAELVNGASVSLTGATAKLCYETDQSLIDTGAEIGGLDQFSFALEDSAGASSAETGLVNITILNLIEICVTPCTVTTNEGETITVTISAELDGQSLDFKIVEGPSNGALETLEGAPITDNTVLTNTTFNYIPDTSYFNHPNVDLLGNSICGGSGSGTCPDTFRFSASTTGGASKEATFEVFVESIENTDTSIFGPSGELRLPKGAEETVFGIIVDPGQDGDMHPVQLLVQPNSLSVKLPNIELLGGSYVTLGACTKGDFCNSLVRIEAPPTAINTALESFTVKSNSDEFSSSFVTLSVIDGNDRAQDSYTLSVLTTEGEEEEEDLQPLILGVSVSVIIGLVFAAALFFYRRRKNKNKDASANIVLPPMSDVEAATSKKKKLHKPVPPNHASQKKMKKEVFGTHHQPAPPKENKEQDSKETVKNTL